MAGQGIDRGINSLTNKYSVSAGTVGQRVEIRAYAERIELWQEGLLKEIAVLPFDEPADASYGTTRTELEAAGVTIGRNDLLIAAEASASGKIIVTDNIREFSRVADLGVVNWLGRR